MAENDAIIPLRCKCGNRDDVTIILPFCSADCGERMEIDVKVLEMMGVMSRFRRRLSELVSIGALTRAEALRIEAGLYTELREAEK